MKTLVADDDPLMRLLHATTLAQRGHEVFQAADGDVALEIAARERPALVVLDWQMPNTDGLTVTRRLREDPSTQDTFVLIVTAREGEDALLHALDAGADDYLTKPFSADGLAARLHIAERRIATQTAHRKAEVALREARYVAGIGETAVAIQHELNNPLAALLGNTQLLQHGLVPVDDQPQVLADVVVQVARISDVLRRLRELEAPRSVEYANGVQMLDLSAREGAA